jgi:hypothetical protein
MINSKKISFVIYLLYGISTLSHAQPEYNETRGELLYSIHCKSCHSSIVHWREKTLATDWTSLKAQVSRWQSNIGLGWGEDDITDVTRHLNSVYYHFQVTNKKDLAEGKESYPSDIP